MVLCDTPGENKPRLLESYGNQKITEQPGQCPTESWLTYWCTASIRKTEESSQGDPIHSSLEDTSAISNQDVPVCWLGQLSHNFKCPLSLLNIKSKERPFDFMLEHYQNPTGVSLCWPLETFPIPEGDCLLFPKGEPTIWYHRTTAGHLLQHMPPGRRAQRQQSRICSTSHCS